MRSRPIICAVVFVLAACNSTGPPQAAFLPQSPEAGSAGAAPRDCEQRRNDTVARLEQCISRAALWRRLSAFQLIADEHPGKHGHPNRNIGTPGYAASVAYVAKAMRQAGYAVTIQRYEYRVPEVTGTPQFLADGRQYALEREWFVARLSGAGAANAPAEPPSGSGDGCSPDDFAAFTRGNVALLRNGADCDAETQVENAENAGAGAAILYVSDGDAREARLVKTSRIPVVGYASSRVGEDLAARYRAGRPARVRIDVRTNGRTGYDYNVIGDSKYGDPNHVVVVDAHLDSIYGAGMLDNASGSTTILQVALALAGTPARNRLRYIWFGGEEVGLLGSIYYTTHLTKAQLQRIVFDVDVDVTATPNFDVLIANPQDAHKRRRFPPNVIPDSKIGNDYFSDYFSAAGIPSRSAWFGNDGTDSLSFSFAGVPNTGILTQQDCCKHLWETKIWGGVTGNYEGKIPSHNGGCVDYPHRWCDNLSNNDPLVLELISRSVGYVTFKLANRHFTW